MHTACGYSSWADAEPGMAPSPAYSYPFAIKKAYKLGVCVPEPGWRRVRVPYRNPYDHALRVTLHTDDGDPAIAPRRRPRATAERRPPPRWLVLQKTLYVIPAQCTDHFALTFQAAAESMFEADVAYGGVSRNIRLWVHNENAGCNEECLMFHVHYTYQKRPM